MAEKYNAKVPTSLTSQFQNRVNKSDAVQNFRKRKERQLTTLYPTGTVQNIYMFVSRGREGQDKFIFSTAK